MAVSRALWVPLCFLAIVTFAHVTADVATAEELTDAKRKIASEILQAYNSDADRIRTVAEHADLAVLAWSAYGEDRALEYAEHRGWQLVREVENKNLIAGDTRAYLFASGDGRHVLAFRGTVTRGDWLTNIAGTVTTAPLLDAQILGAIDVAGDVAAEHSEVTFVGHSLGGRLALIGSLVTGRPAVVFNAAPLGRLETIALMGLSPTTQPTAAATRTGFRSPSDALTRLFPQDDIEVSNIVVPEEWELVERLGIAGNLPAAISELKYNHMAETLAGRCRPCGLHRREGGSMNCRGEWRNPTTSDPTRSGERTKGRATLSIVLLKRRPVCAVRTIKLGWIALRAKAPRRRLWNSPAWRLRFWMEIGRCWRTSLKSARSI